MKVRKAIIPVAGLGTRMLPVTKSIPKEMLPLVDKPIIHYIVEECVSAGITDIFLVDHSLKTAVGNYFDTNYELEDKLNKQDKMDLLEKVQLMIPKRITLASVRQGEAKGLGHAILCARDLVGDEPFVIVLPDVLIEALGSECNLGVMIENYESSQVSQIMVEEVSDELVDQYGIVGLQKNKSSIKSVIEKPLLKNAPSNLAIVGRYVLSPKIWNLLETVKPDHRGEIQLTDAIQMLLEKEECRAHKLTGNSWDCGTKQGYVNAFVHYAKVRNFLN